jgi:hypothetical protein
LCLREEVKELKSLTMTLGELRRNLAMYDHLPADTEVFYRAPASPLYASPILGVGTLLVDADEDVVVMQLRGDVALNDG